LVRVQVLGHGRILSLTQDKFQPTFLFGSLDGVSLATAAYNHPKSALFSGNWQSGRGIWAFVSHC
jgi:hypothetical protein